MRSNEPIGPGYENFVHVAHSSGFRVICGVSSIDRDARMRPRSRLQSLRQQQYPAKIGSQGSARKIGQIELGLGRKQNLAIELCRRTVGRVKPAFMPKNDLAGAKKPRLILEDRSNPLRKQSLKASNSGLGPTMDISPRNTFQNCGNSSILVAARIRPILVRRSSPSNVSG